MALTTEELQRAINAYQGANTPQPVMDVAPQALPPSTASALPMDVPPVAPVVAPAPVVDQALPPSATPLAPPPVDVPMPAGVTNSRGALNEMDAAAGAQIQAEEHKAAAQALANDEQAKLVAKQAEVENAANMAAEQKLEEGRKRVAAIYDQAKAIDTEASAIQVKDKRTTTQRVLGILGTAIASVADGLSGFSGRQTNFANEVGKSIQDSVDRDLAMQREAIADKRKQAASKFTEMGIAQKLFVDDVESATKYASALRKDMYARELDAAAKRSSNPVVQAEGAATAAKILADNAKDKAQLLTSKENAQVAAAAASQRIEQTAATAYRPGSQAQSELERKEREKTITADEQQELEDIRTKQHNREKETGGGKLSEGQQKAQALFQSSEADAARVAKALEGGKLPGAAIARAAESPLVPDAAIPAEAEIYRSARGLVNDVLRDESGASIGASEKEELLSGLKSTDASVRKQSYERILAKRAAMGAKVPTKIQAGGKAVKADIAPDVPAGKVSVIAPDGTPGFIPANKLDLALSRGYKKAE